MPKLKTNKSAQKRVKKTASGKIKMAHSARNHRRAHKSQRQNKQDRKAKLLVISTATKKAFDKLLPNS